jgi:hypothetical protein
MLTVYILLNGPNGNSLFDEVILGRFVLMVRGFRCDLGCKIREFFDILRRFEVVGRWEKEEENLEEEVGGDFK